MLFRLKADATFLAHNMDEAYVRLARHFLNMALGDEFSLESGNVEIKAEEKKDETSQSQPG